MNQLGKIRFSSTPNVCPEFKFLFYFSGKIRDYELTVPTSLYSVPPLVNKNLYNPLKNTLWMSSWCWEKFSMKKLGKSKKVESHLLAENSIHIFVLNFSSPSYYNDAYNLSRNIAARSRSLQFQKQLMGVSSMWKITQNILWYASDAKFRAIKYSRHRMMAEKLIWLIYRNICCGHVSSKNQYSKNPLSLKSSMQKSFIHTNHRPTDCKTGET